MTLNQSLLNRMLSTLRMFILSRMPYAVCYRYPNGFGGVLSYHLFLTPARKSAEAYASVNHPCAVLRQKTGEVQYWAFRPEVIPSGMTLEEYLIQKYGDEKALISHDPDGDR